LPTVCLSAGELAGIREYRANTGTPTSPCPGYPAAVDAGFRAPWRIARSQWGRSSWQTLYRCRSQAPGKWFPPGKSPMSFLRPGIPDDRGQVVSDPFLVLGVFPPHQPHRHPRTEGHSNMGGPDL